MPVIPCKGCGRTTNTAVSEHLDEGVPGKEAAYCFAAWDGERWVEGCAYDKADRYTKPYVDKLIANEENKT